MPYGRGFRRKTYKKKRSFRRSKTYGRVPKKIKRYVKRTLDAKIEDKYTTSNTFASITPSWTPTLVGIAVPAPGTDYNQRVGNAVTPKKLLCWGQYYGTNDHQLRIIGFVWHGLDIPNYNLIIDNASVGTSYIIGAPLAESTKGNRQFTVFYDKRFIAGTINSRYNVPIKFTIPGKKLKKMTWGTGTGVGSTNYIYFMVMQDGVTSLNTIDLKTRFYYEDA